MELETIQMSRNDARTKFLEYRRSVKERHTEEDKLIMRGYREIANGRQVIDLQATLRRGGVDDRNLPRLAAIRADSIECRVAVDFNGHVYFTPDGDVWRSRHATRITVRDLAEANKPQAHHQGWTAVVPHVLAPLRPAAHLRNYHILWEAEWAKKAPPVPRDPALLKHIGGTLYAVVAVWDLTDLERAVLSGRI